MGKSSSFDGRFNGKLIDLEKLDGGISILIIICQMKQKVTKNRECPNEY